MALALASARPLLGGDPMPGFRDVLDSRFALIPVAAGSPAMPRSRAAAPFSAFTGYGGPPPVLPAEDYLSVGGRSSAVAGEVERESSPARAPGLATFPMKRRPFLLEAVPAQGLPLEVNPSLVAANSACARSRTLKEMGSLP